MSVVNTETGEILDLDQSAAERRAERINLRLDAIADNYAAVMPMIREALEKRDDLALGYRSPGEYVADRFGGSLQRLGVEVRREVVRELTAAGMSTRAIAPVVGTSFKTVARDLETAPVSPDTPDFPKFADHMAAHAPASPEGEAEARDQEQAQPEPTAVEPAPTCERPEPAKVIGLDGKQYTRPESRPRPVRPVAGEDEWTAQDRAEELAANLARNVSQLYAVTSPERRAEFIANWHLGVDHRPVLGQTFVTPSHMRELAAALNTFASEWENAHV